MEDAVVIQIPQYVEKILTHLEASGFEAFVVGGCVRDSICNKTPKDWDVCTSATPDCVKEAFDGFLPIILTGEKHGTITVLSDNNPVEVTTFRTDGLYKDNRHPENVSFVSSIEDDLSRRDFTINAMAYNAKCGVIDLFGGLCDIAHRKIRCVGNPHKRFSEDALRIMRALRLSSVCNFEIDKETSLAIHDLKSLLKEVSAERINAELKKLLLSDKSSKTLLDYKDVFEEVLLCALPDYSLKLVDKMPQDLSFRLSAMFLNISGAKKILQRLRFDKRTVTRVHTILENFTACPPDNKISARKMLFKFGAEVAKTILKFGEIVNFESAKEYIYATELINSVIKSNECFCSKMLAINGNDLIDVGISSGKKIGEALGALLGLVIEEKIENQKCALIEYAKTNFIS